MTDTPTTHKEMTLPESVTLYKVDIPNVGTMLTFAEPINPDCTFIMGEYTRHPKPMVQAEWADPLFNKLPMQDEIERVILRRLREEKIDGYTLEMAHEIAALKNPSDAGVRKLWLWKNGEKEYWAFDSLYPTYDGGDPQVLGEPIGYALLKPSVAAPPQADTPQSRASIAYWRERSWPVDNVNMPQDVEDRIYSFMAGWEQARSTLTPRPAQVDLPCLDEALKTYGDGAAIPCSEDLGTFYIESRLFWDLFHAARLYAAQTQDSGNEGWRPMGELPPNTMVRILSQNGNEFNGRHHVTVEKNYGYRAEGGGILDNPRGWKPLPTPAPIDAEVREALNWINCDEAVARDALEKTGSKLPQARVRIYETIRAALKKGGV